MKRALAERASKTIDAAASSSTLSPMNPLSNPLNDHSRPTISSDIATEQIAKRANTKLTPSKVASTNFSTSNNGSTGENSTINKTPRADPLRSPNNVPSSPASEQPKPRGRPGRKRKKEQVPSSDEDDDEESSKAYFLQHQNKALASELHMLKNKIQKLEKEETKWKTTGRGIHKGIRTLEKEWRKSLAMMYGVLYSVGFLRKDQGEIERIQKQSGDSNVFLDSEDEDESLVETPESLLNTMQCIISGLDTSNARIEESMLNSDSKVDLGNLQSLISLVETMSDQAESTLRESVIKWMNNIGLDNLVGAQNGVTQKELKVDDIMNISRLHKKLAEMKQKLVIHEMRIKELEIEKEDALKAEKNVRRGLYRISSGRLKIEEVMKDVENEDNGLLPIHELDLQDQVKETLPQVVSSGNDSPNGGTLKKEESNAKSDISEETKQKLKELETICEFRDGRIKELLQEKEHLQKRINSLISEAKNGHSSNSDISTEQIKQSDIYVEIAAKLATAEAQITSLNETIDDTRKKWGVSKGESEHAKKMMEELNEKHAKRWKALTGSDIDEKEKKTLEEVNTTEKSVDLDTNNAKETKTGTILFSKEITQLEHKLGHALEGVRQVEAIKQALLEALKLNDSLQSQVSEWKSKYTTLSSNKSSSRSSSTSAQKASTSSSSSTHKSSSASKSEASMERLKLDFRKCRKELAAEKNARENYKAKNERLEKERESMMRTNARLIKQSTEKEVMNTKSLSQILQLNHMSELHTQEIETLQQKLKAVEQVALTARLTSNAKARLEDEANKEKQTLGQQIGALNQELSKMRSEKDKAEALANQSKSQLLSSEKDLQMVRNRCDELASESSTAIKDQTKLMESLAVAKREAKDLEKKASSINSVGKSRGNNGSSFTVEQLSTHLSVVKRRLACPVCNDRDKQCILMRCRHMFCKHCIDENIKNRSRKCPACGQRFDMKDVADVWL